MNSTQMSYIKMEWKSILLIFLLIIQKNAASSTLYCIGSKQLDLQCSSYCYDVVKPLLQHANQFYQKEHQFVELEVSLAELKVSDKKNLEIIAAKDNELATERKLVASYESQLASKDAELKKLNEQQFAFKKLEQSLTELKASNKALQDRIDEKDKKLEALNEVITTQTAQLVSMPKNREEKSIQIEQPSCSTEKSGIEKFQLNLVKDFSVFCDAKLVGPGWIVIQRRLDARENFNRSWEDYRLGFGHLASSFFLGLQKLHMLTTSRPHELYIYLKDSDGEVRYAHYDNFVIGDASEQYKLKSLTYLNGTAGDALTAHLGMSFSTYDMDNDLSPLNCGELFYSGWWFTSCLSSNLNGLYRDGVVNQENGILWTTWEPEPSLTFVQMMIRPKGFEETSV